MGIIPDITSEIVAILPRVLIVGDGGSGKTTLLRQMLARAAAAGRTPAWVSLSALPSDGPLTIPVLVDYLVREAGARLGVGEVNREFFESLSSSGQLTVGFDALDECATLAQRQRVRGLLDDVLEHWKTCQVFVTSRPEAIVETPLRLVKDGNIEPFIAVTPLPFTRDDIGPFLRVAFEDGDALAQQLLNRTGIEALIATPLTLTLVGLVARTPKGLPATRTPLFARCLDTVCETWEAAKGAQPPSDGLDPSQRLDVLRRLGWVAQESGGDALDADQARAAVAGAADREIAVRAERVLSGLARRNLLLRAETADDGSFELRAVRFSHPQFREYLAGTHLALSFAADAPAASAAMASYWLDSRCLDSRWLDVLRFAVATVEEKPARRDAILRAVLTTPDPYGDLLHRPELLVAQLLARLKAADAALLAQVTGTIEKAIGEPALREPAASALLGLGQHVSARPAIARFADGVGAALAFPLDESLGSHERMASLRWRLRAIEAHGAASGNALALASLKRLPSIGLDGDLECCLTRVRLGDVAGAEAEFRRLYDEAPDHQGQGISRAMDAAGLGGRFDQWLAVSVAAAGATVVRARLARERGVLRDDAPFWTALFERATAALAQLPADEDHAPQEVADAVYEVFDLAPSARSSAPGRALIEAGLRHRALLWHVASKVVTTMPDLADEAVRRLTDFVVAADSAPVTRDRESRLGGAVGAIASISDSALAVPVLLELLCTLDPYNYQMFRIVNAIRSHGRTREAFDALLPLLEMTPEAAATEPSNSRATARRLLEGRWSLAAQFDSQRVRAVLDARFRGGDPEEDARRLMREWDASGIALVARAWLESIGEDKSDDRAQRFLHTLTTHERDTLFTDFAREALRSHALDTESDPPPVPRTLGDYEREFDGTLKTGTFFDDNDRLQRADARDLADRLSSIAALSDPAAALARAERWIQQTMAGGASGGGEPEAAGTDAEPAAGVPEAGLQAAVERGRQVAEVLDALTSSGLRDARWSDLAAGLARELAPGDRVDLVTWLRTNA